MQAEYIVMSKHIYWKHIYWICVAAIFATLPAMAHHAPSAFDLTKTVIVNGTVEEFYWKNPHTWIYLLVPDGKGGTQEWRLEGHSVNIMARTGWTSDSVKRGDKVKVLASPNRDGTTGGELLSLWLSNGQLLSIGNP